MADRPIIFSPNMVRALLDGRKTQTRRLLKPQPPEGFYYAAFNPVLGWSAYTGDPLTGRREGLTVPYAPGDRLYVREACSLPRPGGGDLLYRADHPDAVGIGWRPSIHMPRWASRLTLTVTEVRVQRLQEISEADAKAEGCGIALQFPHDRSRVFEALWNSLHGPEAWDANPWVVAISFTVLHGNIDQVAK